MPKLNFRKILKAAVATCWFILIAFIYASKDTTWVSKSYVGGGVVVTILIGFWGVVFIITTIGLYCLEPWAKWYFIILMAIDPVLSYLSGPVSVHKSDLASALGYLCTINTYVILCILLCTKAISRKKKLEPHKIANE